MSDLFGDEKAETLPVAAGHGGAETLPVAAGHGGTRPGAGRPKGALSRVNQDLREYLVTLTGREAVVAQWRLASIDPLSEDVHKLARFWGCTPVEAVDRIGAAFARVAPHVYPKLGSIEVRPPGAPSAGDGFVDYLMDEGEDARLVSILDLPYEEIPDGSAVVTEVERHGADRRAELEAPVEPADGQGGEP